MNQPIFIYAALCALILMGLSGYVIKARFSMRIGLGDGGDPDMLRRVRIHSNFVEYVPMALLLIYFVQQAGFSGWVVHVLGSVLVLARLAHVWGLLGSSGASAGRLTGTAGTFGVIIAAATLLLQSAVFHS